MRRKVVSFLFGSALWILPAFAGEYIVLDNGFRLYADRHELKQDLVVVYTSSGTVELARRQVASFEVEEYVKPVELPAAVLDIPFETPKLLSAEEYVSIAALQHGLMPEFVHSVAATESAFRMEALSPKGAIGLMQLMPGTARELGVDAKDTAQNAEGGARYLKQLLLRYKDTSDPVRFALAAYNAGPGAVDKYRGVPPYRETREYVEKVLRKYLAKLQPAKKG